MLFEVYALMSGSGLSPQQKEGAKNEGEKKDDGNVAVVLKMDMHCDGCAKKVRRAVQKLDGTRSGIKTQKSFPHPIVLVNCWT